MTAQPVLTPHSYDEYNHAAKNTHTRSSYDITKTQRRKGFHRQVLVKCFLVLHTTNTAEGSDKLNTVVALSLTNNVFAIKLMNKFHKIIKYFQP
jgi:hypothetical protein